jgi:hypothetical protein
MSRLPGRAHSSYSAVQLEREARQRLPSILADLLDEEGDLRLLPMASDSAYDAAIDSGDRRWLFLFKSLPSPAVVAQASEQLRALRPANAVVVLVVPFMTSGGAATAAERRLNWVDLSGNARIRDGNLYVSVEGRPNQFAARGRPASAFAPKSSRVARTLLQDPERWWRQKELSERTGLDPGRVSRVVRRLEDDELIARSAALVRPRDRDLLLDAWADEYRFDRHDTILGHVSGTGIESARELNRRLDAAGVHHAFTGLPAAWAIQHFARFRLTSVYVTGDPRDAADQLTMRLNERGANVQLIGPDDTGVFDGQREIDGLPCVAPVQVYLDLLALPERASETAAELRHGGLWRAAA